MTKEKGTIEIGKKIYVHFKKRNKRKYDIIEQTNHKILEIKFWFRIERTRWTKDIMGSDKEELVITNHIFSLKMLVNNKEWNGKYEQHS